jgi:P4 family phage/plasmid primase-like protien
MSEDYIENLTNIKQTGLPYIKIIKSTNYHKLNEILDVQPKFAEDMIKEGYAVAVTFEEYKNYQNKQLKNMFLKGLKKKKQEEKKISVTGLKIDNYLDNAKQLYQIKPFFYDDSGIWWVWKENKWSITDDIDMERMLDDELGFFGQTISSSIRNNYLTAMKWVGRKHKPKEAPKKWVQFNDKAFSLKSSCIYEVTKDYFFTNPIPWEMGESEDTPFMDKLFEEWVGKENIQILYEIIAYCCYTDYPIHRIFCLVGCGSNGKSRYLALIERFLGENICASELDDLINNRFESFKLYRKLCCVMGETNFGVLNKTSLIKKLSGQDMIGFEKKNKDPFTAHNYAKILISSNSLPVSDDNTDGFYRRWTIIDFPNQFPEGKDILECIPIIEYNNLAKRCMSILKRILDTGVFTNQGSIQQRKNKYIEVSNPISIFLNESCVSGNYLYANYGELYTLYVQYLKKYKKRRIKSGDFKKSLEDEGYYVEKTTKKINDEFKSGYWVEGLQINENYDNYATNPTLSSICENRVGNSTQLSQISQTINLPCYICGTAKSNYYDDTAQGKPICEFCFEAKKVNEEQVE